MEKSKLKLYNTLTKKKEVFSPLNPPTVLMYACGPTVYDNAHIGNLKTYINWDVLKRYLQYTGYEVKSVGNITDVGHLSDDADEGEDKVEKAARKKKKDPLEIAKHYLNIYLKEERELNILPPTYRPRATEEIEVMQKIIAGLIEKGFAYDAPDGVYFNVSKFEDYGKLSGNTPDKIKSGSRVEVGKHKKSPYDFALWKKCVGANKDHILRWKSPWGEGFPGWHIECSAMAFKYLGETIDIHTGGEDNIFPHHESEIAQSEAFTGKPFSKYWLHTRHLKVKGEKMSKSLGNYYTFSDVKEKGFDPLAFRFWVIASHYRSPVKFSWDALKEAEKVWKKIVEFYADHKDVKIETRKATNYLDEKEKEFHEVMDDDINTPKAVALLRKIVKDGRNDRKKIAEVLTLIERWNKVLGILPKDVDTFGDVEISKEVKDLLKERDKARKKKDFKKADELRKKIEKAGYVVSDKSQGYTIGRR